MNEYQAFLVFAVFIAALFALGLAVNILQE